jgi:predicted transcriptional regulator
MPETTTLRLPDGLKARLTCVATGAGTSAHAFMVDAIAAAVAAAEEQAAFEALADARYQGMLETGEGLLWEEVRPWLVAAAAGRSAPPPTVRKWR